MVIDDLMVAGVSREDVREVVDRNMNGPGASVTSITETPLEREARLRSTWGHSREAQDQWRR